MECKHAYQALSDTKQRSRYDREQVLSHDTHLPPDFAPAEQLSGLCYSDCGPACLASMQLTGGGMAPRTGGGMGRSNQEDVLCALPGASRRLSGLLWLCKLLWSFLFTRRGYWPCQCHAERRRGSQ